MHTMVACEVRKQTGVGSLLPSLCEFQGSHSAHQVCKLGLYPLPVLGVELSCILTWTQT